MVNNLQKKQTQPAVRHHKLQGAAAHKSYMPTFAPLHAKTTMVRFNDPVIPSLGFWAQMLASHTLHHRWCSHSCLKGAPDAKRNIKSHFGAFNLQ